MAVPPPPTGGPKCLNGSQFKHGQCGTGCWVPSGGGPGALCCVYKIQTGPDTYKDTPLCGVGRITTLNPFGQTRDPTRDTFKAAIGPKRPHQPTQLKTGKKMHGACEPGCGCNGNGYGGVNGGTAMSTSSAPPRTPVCWAAAGATALLAGGATTTLTIAIANYSSIQPRKLTIQVGDPANAGTDDVSALVNVDRVESLGRNILGSAAGINAQAIASDADNGLVFGGSLPPITASNTIDVTVTNNGTAALRVSAVVEGAAYQ